MGTVRQVLFGKVDLDTLTTALVLGLNPGATLFRPLAGAATGTDLSDPTTVVIEGGGSGRTAENNFDHHGEGAPNLSACAQALERLARIVRYVDELDRGLRRAEQVDGDTFPSLAQLISGMLLVVKKPEQRMEKGLEILQAVLQSGTDPYGSMEPILDAVPHGRLYARIKREHDRHFEAVCASAQWFTTEAGHKLAVVETTWIGAPGALYGQGADAVLALNPAMEKAGSHSGTYRKFTLAVNRTAHESLSVLPALGRLQKLEAGWGGPNHGGICGSPRDVDSTLSLDQVTNVAIETL